MNRLTKNQKQLINKINPSDIILYEFTEYDLERNQEYSQVLMQRDGAGFLSTTYTYGNQRINSESINNLSGIYTYDGRGSVSSVIGGWGDFRATYWYDGLGNVKSQIHGYGAFGSGKRYFGYNAEQYNPVTGNQNLRARQVNIRRQRFLSEDTYLGNQTDTLSINRYIYAEDNPLKYKDPSGNLITTFSNIGLTISSQVKEITNLAYEGLELTSFARQASLGLTTSLRIASNLTNSNTKGCYNVEYNYSEYYDPNLPDYTDAINELLYREELNYINYRNDSYIGQFAMGIIGLDAIGSVAARIRNMSYFYELEQTGGRLDIKAQNRWVDAFSDEIPWLGNNINIPESRFIYDNEVMTADILGNVTYGYWGKAMGFTDDEIYYGGGLVEQMKKNGMILSEFVTNPNLMIPYLLDPLYGDAPEDHAAIKRGIDLYHERHR